MTTHFDDVETRAADETLRTSARKIRLVVFDFDGVFTDNTVIVSEDGAESVVCWRGDGIGLGHLRSVGIDCLVLSTECNPVVSMRSRKLDIECHQGCDDKLQKLRELAVARKLDFDQIAYLGNDVNDAACLRAVGLPVVVADAHADVRTLARLTTNAAGGKGAVRELCDFLAGCHRQIFSTP